MFFFCLCAALYFVGLSAGEDYCVENSTKNVEGENLLAKFDELTKVILKGKAKMKAEIDAYNIEKEKMKGVEVKDDDIIHLNVGGHKMSTKRSTLCQVKGSLLTSMFDGRWEDSLGRDKDGYVFFDFDPDLFVVILSYLRAKKVGSVENPASPPKIAPNQEKHFNNLIEYLGLADELAPKPEVKPKDSFAQHSDQITIHEEGKTALHSSNQGHQYVLGANTHNEGVIHWQLKIASFMDENWMFIGVVKADSTASSTTVTSYEWPGSFGWALGRRNQVFSYGRLATATSLPNLTKEGDIVKLTLNCPASKLSLFVEGDNFDLVGHLDLPQSSTWRLHINLHGHYDKISIV